MPLDRLLESCVVPKVARSAEDLSDVAVDWMRTLERANSFFAVPPLKTAIWDAGLQSGLPADVARYLELIHSQNSACNEALRAQCIEIGTVLAAGGARAVLLKGAAWLFDAGPSRGDRMMRDIDLLVSNQEFPAAKAALVASGYYVPDTIDAEVDNIHDLPLVKDGQPANLELHLDLATRPHMLLAGDLMAEAVQVAPGLLMPSLRHRIIHNVIHAQLTNGDYVGGVVSLRDLIDLARLVQAGSGSVDWTRLAADARRDGYFRQLAGALHKARVFVGVELPPPFDGDAGGRRHALRCQLQRRFAVIDRQVMKIGVLHRALLWERDAYQLKLGASRTFAAHLQVNRRRAQRIGKLLGRTFSGR